MNTKKWAIRAGKLLGVLLVLLACAIAFGLWSADRKMNRQVPVDVKGVAFRTDAASVERGKYLFASRGCVDCHGAAGNGRVFLDDGAMRIVGPNLTPAPGSVVAGYEAKDWERAIRHGVTPQGRPLLIMPSEDYNRFTDDDLAALVAYVRSLPAATGEKGEVRLPLPVRVLYGFGAIQDAAAKIDHSLPPAQPVAEGVNLSHGAYVANMCMGCHGANLQGGKVPGGPPDWPAAADLRTGSAEMARYPDEQSFLKMFRTGKRPDGTAVQVMPFESLGQMNDTDVRALYLYLKQKKS